MWTLYSQSVAHSHDITIKTIEGCAYCFSVDRTTLLFHLLAPFPNFLALTLKILRRITISSSYTSGMFGARSIESFDAGMCLAVSIATVRKFSWYRASENDPLEKTQDSRNTGET